MERLWKATAEAVQEALKNSGVSPRSIVCVSCTGHGNGLYLVDRQGRPVRNAIISTDTRAKDYVARWYADGVAKSVLPRTMQSLWPGQPNALLAWLRDHEPDTLRSAGWVLMCKDYIRFRLTGQIHGELTDMSGTSLIDVARGDYDPEILEAFGLADIGHLLPPIRRSEEVCGEVTLRAAEDTGLAEGTPVACGVFDIDACALASGIVEESQLSLIAGTWSINQYVSRTPVIDGDLFMCSRYCIPGYYLIPEASATSASNLEWFATEFFAAEEAAARRSGESVYDVINDLVATTPPEETNIVFLPFLFGSNADANAKACLIGLGGWHHRGHVLRAIQEGIVFGHKAHVDRLMRFRPPAATIRLTGGAARSLSWSQMFADVFQTSVEIPAGTELGALGAAICATVGTGRHSDYHAAVGAMVHIPEAIQPNPDRRDLYAQKYERYRRALAALRGLWHDLT